MLPDEALKSMKVMYATSCYISAVSKHELTMHGAIRTAMYPAYAFGKPDHPLAQHDCAQVLSNEALTVCSDRLRHHLHGAVCLPPPAG
jgi:hypothetical protein